MAVHFFFLKKNISLNRRAALKAQITTIFKYEGYKVGSLSYVFCSDKHLLGLNKRHLSHDYYTDIITFDLSEGRGKIDGEIYISTDRVRDNAAKLGVTIKEELHRVVFHGALHLCGYKDKNKKEKGHMRKKENHYLNSYFKRLHVEH